MSKTDSTSSGIRLRDGGVLSASKRKTYHLTLVKGIEMSHWLIAATGIAYLWVSVEQFYKGNVSTGMVWAGYAFSQIGLWRLAS